MKKVFCYGTQKGEIVREGEYKGVKYTIRKVEEPDEEPKKEDNNE